MVVVLPCYASAWEARTASECLEQLQSLPAQCHFSTALGLLQNGDDGSGSGLELSGFGMFTLMAGTV